MCCSLQTHESCCYLILHLYGEIRRWCVLSKVIICNGCHEQLRCSWVVCYLMGVAVEILTVTISSTHELLNVASGFGVDQWMQEHDTLNIASYRSYFN